MAKSIEEQVEDWCKNQLEKYFTKTESINFEIDEALKKAPSKKGGSGQNLPDIKCFVSVDFRNIPVMVECKGTKGDFIKTDENGLVSNTNKKGEPDYAAIAKYAVNGAIHYAKSILDYTETYQEAIAVGVNGYKQNDDLKTEIGVYYLSKENLGIPKEVEKFTDLSFLKKKNWKNFFKMIDEIQLTSEELENRKLALEDEIESKLKRLNQTMHDDLGIAVKSRVMLIVGLIMAGLGVEEVSDGLKVEELKGETGKKSNDGQKIVDKIEDFLREKKLPEEKREVIMNEVSNVFKNQDLYTPQNGESKLRKVYTIVHNDILPYLSSELHNIDFTGRLFNVLNDWVDVPDGAENDVVLTPRYVTEVMARLASVNKDSYVWDYATGSAGFLISAMHLMIADATRKIKSPDELRSKMAKIKAEQLIGIEKLPEIYILAVLNMILMGDGSSNIINGNSLTQFDGKYQQGKLRDEKFPANVFLLNPPYSAPGKGMIFVEKALSQMSGGKAAVLIQENAGSSQGEGFTRRILERNTLVASIHMSTDLFIGKSSVQTAIYVFDVGVPHDTEKLVKFIDFSNDGYARQNRKKSSQCVNLKDVDNAKERYDELVNLVVRGKGKDEKNLNYYKDCYIEDYISLEGNDWTYSQHKKINIKPTEDDFKKVVQEYMAWLIGDLIKNGDDCLGENSIGLDDCELTKEEKDCINGKDVAFEKFTIGDLFDIHPTKAYKATNKNLFHAEGKIPVVANSSVDNGIGG